MVRRTHRWREMDSNFQFRGQGTKVSISAPFRCGASVTQRANGRSCRLSGVPDKVRLTPDLAAGGEWIRTCMGHFLSSRDHGATQLR
jgi:hypothetical protein